MADIDVEERKRQAEDLNKSLGLSDPGNLDSFLSGRSSFDEYKKDNEARANNDTGDRQFDSQDTRYFNQQTNQLTPEGLSQTFQLTGGAGSGNLDYWKNRGIDPQNIFNTTTGQPNSGWSRVANGYSYNGPALAAKQNPAMAAPKGQSFGFGLPGGQFGGDAYSGLLENIAQEQLNGLRNPTANPALDQLLSFLGTRFNELSTNPGYAPGEMALLRTQTLDPIEADRAASQKRVLERTASRGFLPSSGLTELDSQTQDATYDKLRGAAERDLGVNAINRRDQNLNQALQIGSLAGVQIPQMQLQNEAARRQEMLNTANILYQMPRQSLMDALAVINGSPAAPDLFGSAVSLMNSQQNAQQINNQQNAAFWSQLGELFGNLFG